MSRPGHVSLVVNGAAEPFTRYLERSAALAAWLEGEAGLGPRDRLIVALENGREHVELVLAAWRLGLQLVVAPPTTSLPTFAGIVERVSPQAVVVDGSNERLSRVVQDWSGAAVPLPEAEAPPAAGGGRVVMGRRAPSLREDRPVRPDAAGGEWRDWLGRLPEAVFFTSGSTSTAKGVPLLWPRILDKATAVLGAYGVTPADRVMPILPLSHVYGLYCLMGALALDTDCITYRESASPAALAEGLAGHGATVVICPPVVGAFLFGRHGAPAGVGERLRVLSMGGAATSRAQEQRIVAGLPRTRVFLSYGLVETYSTICCNEVSLPGSDPASVGAISFGASGEARDPETGRAVAAGQIGELCVGGTIMRGYLDDATDCFTKDGLFRTGDLVRFDPKGAMSITGRLKEMINAGGLSINPSEIEEALRQHPAVADSGVFGEAAGDLEVACAAVVLREPGDTAARQAFVDELFTHCRSHLAVKMVPRRILVVDAIPRGALGKIARAELRALCARSPDP